MPSPSPAPSASSSTVRTRPSPSLSPSITSLLNNSNNDDLTPFNTQDYFNTPTTSTSDEQISPFSNLNAPSSSTSTLPPPPSKRPRPSSSPSSEPSSLPTQMPPPSNTHSRSRPTSSSAHRPPPPAPAPPAPPNVPRRSSGESKLEASVFNVEPIDEFTREVADWLWGFCSQLDWDKVEIEAKIGLLVDQRQGGQRVYLPVPTEAILTDDTGLRFQSNMSQSQHKSFNQLLNARVVETSHPSYPHSRIAYSHTHELDTFHQLPGPEKRKVRVTRDEKKKDSGVWKAVEKVRVADMNVFSPKRLFDWRVSISLENPVTELPPTPPTHSRRKDRISYSHQLYTIDLTQVSTPSQPPQEPTHELEIEFKDAKRLLGEAEKESRGEVNWYLQGVQGMLNNVRMLIRNASDP